jgi:hypothetical protein
VPLAVPVHLPLSLESGLRFGRDGAIEARLAPPVPVEVLYADVQDFEG